MRFENPETGEIRVLSKGWSWTIFLFGWFCGIPYFMRGINTFGWIAAAIFFLVTVSLYIMVLAVSFELGYMQASSDGVSYSEYASIYFQGIESDYGAVGASIVSFLLNQAGFIFWISVLLLFSFNLAASVIGNSITAKAYLRRGWVLQDPPARKREASTSKW